VAAEHRAQMVRLATSGNPLFVFDDRELKRTGPSYTVDTLGELRAEHGPRRPLALLMGADAFLGLTAWRNWRELFELAHIVVAHRPGFRVDGWIDDMPPALAHEYAARRVDQALALHLTPAGAVFVTPITALDISATAIRATLRAGRSPRYLLPDAVLDYIRSNQLYL
jgi:nicotinate-nucleotide adenylyltransferase